MMAERKPIVIECAICLENLFAPKTLICGHIFCNGCAQQLQEQICPLCRADLDPQEWKAAMTTCKSCEKTTTIEQSQTHTCACMIGFTVISKKQHSQFDERVRCSARVVSWTKGEPCVLLDGEDQFSPAPVTYPLRLWVLHKDGSMSHFSRIETLMDLPQNDDLEECRVFFLRWSALPREITDKSPILRWEGVRSRKT